MPFERSIPGYSVGQTSPVERRARFIARTYNHLFGAIAAFALIEIGLFATGLAVPIARAMLSAGPLVLVGGFVLAGWLASRAAATSEKLSSQYLALTGYVLAEALVFIPILVIAERYAPGAIQSAALATFLGFGALTAIAFVSRKDFSFLGALVKWGFAVALVAVVAGAIFGFQLGMFFSVAMIGLSGAAILYDTSAVLRDFPEDRYVAASLHLFASVATMFFYVLRLLMSLNRR